MMYCWCAGLAALLRIIRTCNGVRGFEGLSKKKIGILLICNHRSWADMVRFAFCS